MLWFLHVQGDSILVSRLSESDADLFKVQYNHGVLTESRLIITKAKLTSNLVINSTAAEGLQVGVHTIERSITRRVNSEVANVISTVKFGLQATNPHKRLPFFSKTSTQIRKAKLRMIRNEQNFLRSGVQSFFLEVIYVEPA